MMRRLSVVLLLVLAGCLGGCGYKGKQKHNFEWGASFSYGLRLYRNVTAGPDIAAETEFDLSSSLMGPPDPEPEP